MQPTAGGTLDLLRYAFEILPGLYDLYVSEIDVGAAACGVRPPAGVGSNRLRTASSSPEDTTAAASSSRRARRTGWLS